MIAELPNTCIKQVETEMLDVIRDNPVATMIVVSEMSSPRKAKQS